MMDRRRFLASLGAGTFVVLGIPSRKAMTAPRKVALSLAKFDRLKPVGGWIVVKIKEREVLVVHDAEGSVRAFDPVCTHMACLVGYKPEDRRFVCPCHFSTYDLDGKVLGGPAPRPLTRYDAVLEGDRIVLTLDLPEAGP